MAVTINEALENAKANMETVKRQTASIPILQMQIGIAVEQLTNGIGLLEKGYSLEDEVEPLLEEFGSLEGVPEKDTT